MLVLGTTQRFLSHCERHCSLLLLLTAPYCLPLKCPRNGLSLTVTGTDCFDCGTRPGLEAYGAAVRYDALPVVVLVTDGSQARAACAARVIARVVAPALLVRCFCVARGAPACALSALVLN